MAGVKSSQPGERRQIEEAVGRSGLLEFQRIP